MVLVEASVFLLFLAGFCTWLLLSDRLTEWKDRRQARVVSRAIDRLQGEPIEAVLDRFGPPREQFTGSTGRSIYVWRRPPSAQLPDIRGVLVVTLTVNSNGRVAETVWHRM
jgi:hypothetical protein